MFTYYTRCLGAFSPSPLPPETNSLPCNFALNIFRIILKTRSLQGLSLFYSKPKGYFLDLPWNIFGYELVLFQDQGSLLEHILGSEPSEPTQQQVYF